MTSVINLKLDGTRENPWPDLAGAARQGRVIHMGNMTFDMVGIPGGMTSGKPSVMFRFDLPDGRVLIAETSLLALQMALAGLRGRYGEQ